jgi:hypothetical protein
MALWQSTGNGSLVNAEVPNVLDLDVDSSWDWIIFVANNRV